MITEQQVIALEERVAEAENESRLTNVTVVDIEAMIEVNDLAQAVESAIRGAGIADGSPGSSLEARLFAVKVRVSALMTGPLGY
jgi:hypothetical protein